MASVITRGLSLIEFGDLASDGGPATTFTQLGKTLRDTCEVVQDDAEIQEYLSEELDAPMDRSITLGKVNINLTIMDPDLAAMAALMGGAVTGTGAAQVYSAPSVAPIIEKTIRITPVKGYKIVINRASLVGTLNFKANRKDVLSITLKGVALVPNKTGVAIWNTAV